MDHKGQLITQQVSRKIDYGLCEILCITAGDHTLHTTSHHSLLTDTGWALAGKVSPGDTLQRVNAEGRPERVRICAVTRTAPERVFNLHTTGPHTAVVEGIVTHNFNKFRWIRVRWHQLFIDPWVQEIGELPAVTASL